jgi:hypothetical protein
LSNDDHLAFNDEAVAGEVFESFSSTRQRWVIREGKGKEAVAG